MLLAMLLCFVCLLLYSYLLSIPLLCMEKILSVSNTICRKQHLTNIW